MAPTMESVRSPPRVRTPGGALRFGRTALLAGWFVFALAAILSPCIQAIAAPVSDRAQNVVEAFAARPIGHPLNERLLTENADNCDGSSSCHLASAMPENVITPLALTANYPPPWWVAIEGIATPSLVGLTRSRKLVQHEIPPPPRRLYLRTLRLLI